MGAGWASHGVGSWLLGHRTYQGFEQCHVNAVHMTGDVHVKEASPMPRTAPARWARGRCREWIVTEARCLPASPCRRRRCRRSAVPQACSAARLSRPILLTASARWSRLDSKNPELCILSQMAPNSLKFRLLPGLTFAPSCDPSTPRIKRQYNGIAAGIAVLNGTRVAPVRLCTRRAIRGGRGP